MPLAAFVVFAPQAPSFERVAAYRYWSAGLSGEGAPERAQGYRVTGGHLRACWASGRSLGRALSPGRGARRAPGRGAEPRALAAPLRRRPGRDRPRAAPRRRASHRRRRDAKALRVPGVQLQGRAVDAASVDKAAALADPAASGSVVALGRLEGRARARPRRPRCARRSCAMRPRARRRSARSACACSRFRSWARARRGRRSSPCSGPCSRCCCSARRISPGCCSRAASRASASSPCASRSARAARSSRASSCARACCSLALVPSPAC